MKIDESEEKKSTERVKTPVLPDSNDESKKDSIEKEINTLDISNVSGSNDESDTFLNKYLTVRICLM